MIVVLTLTLLLLALATLKLLCGAVMISPDELWRVLGGARVPGASFLLTQDRIPIVLSAIAGGIALALSGSLTQTLLRNPLASPDVLGISSGATVATVAAMTLGLTDSRLVSVFTFVGGIATALIILAFAGRGSQTGVRLILTGIAIGSMLHAVVAFLVTRLDLRVATDVMRWTYGSFSGATPERTVVIVVGTTLLALLVPLAVRTLKALELGDELATGIGSRVNGARLAIVLLAVLLLSLPIAVIGPMTFTAFMAGPLSRQLLGGRRSFPVAALTGAVILLGAEVLGTFAFGAVHLPAGIITGAFGAPFLLWMFFSRSGRRKASS